MLKGDLVQRIQDSNRFELMRFAVFKEIEEYLEENPSERKYLKRYEP